MPNISYQLYCSRNFSPMADTLSMLADAGYTEVEGFGGLYGDPAGLRALLDARDLAMTSGHFGLSQLEGDPKGMLAAAQTLGMTRVYCPYVMAEDRPTDAAGWRAFAARVHAAGAPFRDAGLTYGWHNHDFELKDLGGTTPLDIMAEAGLMLELDLAWVRVAGADPVAWLRKYAGRISSVHIKDRAADGQNRDEDGWADVGHGVTDWGPIRAALAETGVTHWVIEHDNPKDHARFARRSLNTVKGW
jgi:sugar phosphate isomerase/epimerase